MAEYIERETVIKTLKDNVTEMERYIYFGSNLGIPEDEIEDIVNEIPVADVDVGKHGRWIYESLGFGAYRYRCSECGNIYGQDQIEEFKHSKFCGDCGAKMDTE